MEQSNSPEVRETNLSRKRFNRKRIIRYFFYAVGLIVILYALFFSNLFKVRQIEVRGNTSAINEQIQSATEKQIHISLFSDNWLLINTLALATQLQEQFPQQNNIRVSKQIPNKLIITSDELKPAMKWKTGSKTFLVSTNGKVISEISQNEMNHLPLVVDSSNIPVEVSNQVVSARFVEFVSKVIEYLNTANLNPNQLFVAETTTELNVATNKGYIVKFDTTQKVEGQLRALTGVLNLLKTQNKIPAAYIDLRIENKAFYK